MQAETNMMKNEIHDLVISLENIREQRNLVRNNYQNKISELEREEKAFLTKLSNL